MTEQPAHPEQPQVPETELPGHVDVLIVGAGLSGIGAACHLAGPAAGHVVPRCSRPGSAIGGTWDLFRYPGRALGLRHVHARLPVPAVDRATRRSPTGPSILEYMRETAREHGIDEQIRFGHRVVRAEWSHRGRALDRARQPRRRAGGADVRVPVRRAAATTATTRATRPSFAGVERLPRRRQVVHPQHWPEDLDYAGKRVVVIGSGATAVTLVPAMAMGEGAAHVTMLQRSPTYIAGAAGAWTRSRTGCARCCRRRRAYAVTRWKNDRWSPRGIYQLGRRRPRAR